MTISCMYNRLTVAQLQDLIYDEHRKGLGESDQYLIQEMQKIIDKKTEVNI